MMKIAAAGHEMFAHLLGLFAEAGVTVTEFAGGNEFYVPDDTVIEDAELHDEIARAVRPGSVVPPLAPVPPGGGDSPAPPETSPQATPRATSDGGDSEGQADLPPKAGPGSSRQAWADAARARGKTVTDDMTRDDIIKILEAPDGR